MSIFRRKSDGKWRVQINYTGVDGKYHRICQTAKTRKEAVQLESMMRAKMEGTTSPDVTMGVLFSKFLDHNLKTKRSSTIANYMKVYRLHLEPYFKDAIVSKVSVSDLERWKKELSRKGYTISYLAKVMSTLKGIVRFGFKEYGIKCQAIERIEGFRTDPNALPEERKIHYWDVGQCLQFLSVLDRRIEESEKEKGRTDFTLRTSRAILAVMMFAGLRKGEANALKVEDFHDGDHPFLRVTKSVNEKLKGIPYLVTPPKNRSSVRDVPVPGTLAEILREHVSVLERVAGYTRRDFFLCGGPRPVADTTYAKAKEETERMAGLPHIRIHDLRHSYVSILINAGTDPNAIAALVGHSSPRITMEVYSHIFPKTKNDVVDRLDELIKGGQKR